MKHLNRFTTVFVLLMFAIVMTFPLKIAQAGTLTTPRDYLNRVKENLTTGVQHEVFFTTATAVSGGAGLNKVILVFPDADDAKWCYSAGTITATGVANPTGGTESATSLPGTLAGSCTQGAGASSYDTFTVTGVNDLSATTKYGVRITGNGGAFGTPANTTTGLITIKTNNGSTDVDSADTAVDIISNDQVVVTATVPPSITFTLGANSIALGTLSAGSVSSGSHTVRTVANSVAGYTTLVYDDGNLRKGSDDIGDVGDGTVTAGAEEYGISTTDTGQTITNDVDCSTPFSASALTTTQQSVAGGTLGPVDETITVCYAASITSTTIAGAYQHTVTFLTVGLF